MEAIISEFMTQFRSVETRGAYTRDIRALMTYMRAREISDLRQTTLKDLKKWQKTLETSPGTRRRVACVKSLFKFMYNNDYISENVGRVLTVPKKTPIKNKRQMTREGVLDLIGATTTNQERLLVSLLYYLGVRRDEIRLLKKHDITLKNGSLLFTATGKGNKTRTIPLSKSKTALIQPLLDEIKQGYVFKGRFGQQPMSKSGIHNVMKRVASRAQKPCVSCHWMRHACASHLLDAKATLAQVRDHLGHSNVSVTNTYLFSIDNEITSLLD